MLQVCVWGGVLLSYIANYSRSHLPRFLPLPSSNHLVVVIVPQDNMQTVEVGRTVELVPMDVVQESHNLETDTPKDTEWPMSEPDIIAHQTNSNDFSWQLKDKENANTANCLAYSLEKEGITNPQWITQSRNVNGRPFFDVGLDGTGQIVAVANGGLDRENCYFYDKSSSTQIYGSNGWNLNQHKIFHYDDSFGDRAEKSQGHGTYVSSIIAGKRSSDGTNEDVGHADDAAPGSQLAFYDIANGYTGIADPGVDCLLKPL